MLLALLFFTGKRHLSYNMFGVAGAEEKPY
jgi:hypothetical protein